MAKEAGTTNYLVNKVARVTFDERDTAKTFVTLQRMIGQGHSGTVWAATLFGADRRQQYSVAVKVLNRTKMSETLQAHFANAEVGRLVKLLTPSDELAAKIRETLVPLVGLNPEEFAIVTELGDRNLKTHITQEVAIPVLEQLRLMHQVATALNYVASKRM
eukprot:2573734-Amphidinium_carterae.1